MAFVCTWCGEMSVAADPVDGEDRCADCMPADAEECSDCGALVSDGKRVNWGAERLGPCCVPRYRARQRDEMTRAGRFAEFEEIMDREEESPAPDPSLTRQLQASVDELEQRWTLTQKAWEYLGGVE